MPRLDVSVCQVVADSRGPMSCSNLPHIRKMSRLNGKTAWPTRAVDASSSLSRALYSRQSQHDGAFAYAAENDTSVFGEMSRTPRPSVIVRNFATASASSPPPMVRLEKDAMDYLKKTAPTSFTGDTLTAEMKQEPYREDDAPLAAAEKDTSVFEEMSRRPRPSVIVRNFATTSPSSPPPMVRLEKDAMDYLMKTAPISSTGDTLTAEVKQEPYREDDEPLAAVTQEPPSESPVTVKQEEPLAEYREATPSPAATVKQEEPSSEYDDTAPSSAAADHAAPSQPSSPPPPPAPPLSLHDVEEKMLPLPSPQTPLARIIGSNNLLESAWLSRRMIVTKTTSFHLLAYRLEYILAQCRSGNLLASAIISDEFENSCDDAKLRDFLQVFTRPQLNKAKYGVGGCKIRDVLAIVFPEHVFGLTAKNPTAAQTTNALNALFDATLKRRRYGLRIRPDYDDRFAYDSERQLDVLTIERVQDHLFDLTMSSARNYKTVTLVRIAYQLNDIIALKWFFTIVLKCDQFKQFYTQRSLLSSPYIGDTSGCIERRFLAKMHHRPPTCGDTPPPSKLQILATMVRDNPMAKHVALTRQMQEERTRAWIRMPRTRDIRLISETHDGLLGHTLQVLLLISAKPSRVQIYLTPANEIAIYGQSGNPLKTSSSLVTFLTKLLTATSDAEKDAQIAAMGRRGGYIAPPPPSSASPEDDDGGGGSGYGGTWTVLDAYYTENELHNGRYDLTIVDVPMHRDVDCRRLPLDDRLKILADALAPMRNMIGGFARQTTRYDGLFSYDLGDGQVSYIAQYRTVHKSRLNTLEDALWDRMLAYKREIEQTDIAAKSASVSDYVVNNGRGITMVLRDFSRKYNDGLASVYRAFRDYPVARFCILGGWRDGVSGTLLRVLLGCEKHAHATGIVARRRWYTATVITVSNLRDSEKQAILADAVSLAEAPSDLRDSIVYHSREYARPDFLMRACDDWFADIHASTFLLSDRKHALGVSCAHGEITKVRPRNGRAYELRTRPMYPVDLLKNTTVDSFESIRSRIDAPPERTFSLYSLHDIFRR